MELNNVVEVPLDQIQTSRNNVRSDLNSQNSLESLNELAENIRVNGLMQPIVLKGKPGDSPPYDVIVGQRRFLAHKILRASTIKATFSGEIDDVQALLLSLSENMCRQEMNNEDISTAITKLYNHFGSEYEVKNRTGFSIRMIRSFLKIEAQASDKIKALLRDNKISMTDAKRAIDASQGDKVKADVLIDELVKLSKYEKKRLVETGLSNPMADVSELLGAAKKPKLEETIILNLPRKVHSALLMASERLSIEVEELTIKTLVSWLKTNDFLVE